MGAPGPPPRYSFFGLSIISLRTTHGGGPSFGGKTVQRENYAMAGAILVSQDGLMYFAKMIGPAEVVKGNREKFVKMIKSVGE